MPNQDMAKGAARLIALALRVLGPVKVVHFEVPLGIAATDLGTATYSICHGQAPWERTKLMGVSGRLGRLPPTPCPCRAVGYVGVG